MQMLLLHLGLFSHLTTAISAASIGLQTTDSALDLFENDILASGTSNDTLHVIPNNFPPLNASSILMDIGCVPPTAQVPRILVHDYYEAVDQILTRDDAMIPKQWDLGPTATQGGGLTWSSSHCVIRFTAKTRIRTQPLPIILAAHMAALVVKTCVTEAQGYRGGGARMRIPGQPWVLVLGTPSVGVGVETATA